MARAERIVREVFTLAFAETEQEKSCAFPFEGEVIRVLVDMPNFATTLTGTLTITDPDDYTMLSQASLARNAVSTIDPNLPVPLSGANAIKLALSAPVGAEDSGEAKVVVYARRCG